MDADIRIVPVTGEIRTEAESLSVAPGQEDFIEPVTECMAEADEVPDWEPVAIYADGKMAGFAMYGYMRHEKKPRVWFDRLLIDRHYQHRGYGKRAAEMILQRIKDEFPGRDIYISAYEENVTAIEMYESMGFHMNGELDINGEKIMVLRA